jgi:hypothetical protein
MHIVSIPGLRGQFLYGLFFEMLYATLIVSSDGPGDVSSSPLQLRIITMVILGVFWHYFLPPKFCGRAPHKSSHPFSRSLSHLRQLPCLKSQITRKVLPELPCPHELEPSNHSREPSPCVLQVSLLFGKHPFIYMHVCICFGLV